MFRSTRFRLALWYAVLFSVSFLLLSLVIYGTVSRMLSDSLDHALMGEAKWMTARMERRVAHEEPAGEVIAQILDRAAFYPEKEYIEIWDAAGNLFFHSKNLGDVDSLVSYTDRSDTSHLVTVKNFHNQDIRMAVLRSPGTAVYLAMPDDSVTYPLGELLKILAWLGPIVVIMAVAAGTIFARRTFSKINEVAETARRITADRLNDRIPADDTKDEIGMIVSTFNEMFSRLELSFTQMKQFSADASHELRTPLAVMRSQLETALDDGASVSEIRMIIGNCLDETLRMTSIIDSLLLLARGESGPQTLRQERVDLPRILEQVHDECVILASPKSISVKLKAGCSASVVGDEERLRQMLLNLIDNAIKYSPPGGQISLTLARENGRAAISVADEGIGVPASEIPRIFDRFYRVDRARSRELGGAGLGLSIAQWIVNAHGGTIEVKSTPNMGSEFTVFLPLGEEEG